MEAVNYSTVATRATITVQVDRKEFVTVILYVILSVTSELHLLLLAKLKDTWSTGLYDGS